MNDGRDLNREPPVDAPTGDRPAGPSDGYRKVVLQGAAWLVAARLLSRGTSMIVRTLVMAALLGPEEFGRFGLCLLILACVELLTDTGFNKALVQKKGDVLPYLNTAWTVQLIRGITLGSLVYLGAPYITSFFHNAGDAITPLRVLALTPILTGLTSISLICFEREMQFKKLFVVFTGEALLDLLVSVAFALWSPTVWALVAGRFASQTFRVAVSYAMATRNAKPGFDRSKFHQLHRFGVWIFVSNVIVFVLTRGSDFVVGRLMPLEMLAIFQLAYALATTPTMELMRVLNTVTFPVLSQLQGHPARLQSAFLRSFLAICTVVMLITCLTIVVANDLVASLLDEDWELTSTLIPPLAVWGACRALGAFNSTVFQAVGRPALATVFQLVMLVLWVASIYYAISVHGLFGVSVCLAVIGVVIQILRCPLTASVLDIPAVEIYVSLVIPITALLSSLGSMWFVKPSTATWSIWYQLPVHTVVVIGTYTFTLLLWNLFTPYKVLSTMTQLVPRRFIAKLPLHGVR